MNNVLLTFTWSSGHSKSFVTIPESEPDEQSLMASVAGILQLFSQNETLVAVDRDSRVFSIVGKDIISVEAESVMPSYRNR
jgi:hypothetical protein